MMGMSPDQVLSMPLYDYQAAIHHFNQAQGTDDESEEQLSELDFDEMLIGMAGHSMGNH